MRVVEIPHGLILAANEPGYVRSQGLHMSDLYGVYFKDKDPKRYDKKGADGEELPFDVTVMDEGMAFESWLEPQLRKRHFGERPGEFFTQHADDCVHSATVVENGAVICPCGAGIAYSPDWLFYEEDPDLVLGEFKRTKYSMRGAPFDKKFAKWVCQMQCYCYHLRTHVARLFVLFINGDYSFKSPNGDEQIKAWQFTFGQRELTDNWNTLLRHARKTGLLKRA